MNDDWAKLLIIYLVFLTTNMASTTGAQIGSENSPQDFYVSPETGRIHDAFGRERIFHGLNVVVKDAPWHPLMASLDTRFSFTDCDIALLKAWGMTVVRLGVMWPGVEPIRGHVNHTYIEVIQSIVEKLHLSGIYTLLEFHQDLYSSPFCGEGFPSWILDSDDFNSANIETVSSASLKCPKEILSQMVSTENLKGNSGHRRAQRKTQESDLQHPGHQTKYPSKHVRHHQAFEKPKVHTQVRYTMQYPASFPEPLGRRWPWPSEAEKGRWEPSIESCSKHKWWFYYLSYAVSRAFQDLYDNKWEWTDLLARYWIVVAGAFKDQPGILGYELMNEPWPGDVFSNPFLFLPGVADAYSLSHFYERLQAAVRSVDGKRLLFFETITFDNFLCGLRNVPGGKEWQNKTVLSYHYYRPPNFSTKQTFAERSRESKRLGCGSMLTEFFVSNYHYKSSKQFWDFRNRILNVATKRNVIKRKSQTDFFAKNSEVDKPKQTSNNPKDDSVSKVLSTADDYVQSWIGWEYKAFFLKTGSIVEQSLFDTNGTLNADLAKTLARTYPQSVCGNIKSFSFDPLSSRFSLSFLAAPDCRAGEKQAFTEIFVHRGFYYPHGLIVEISHLCSSFSEAETLITVSHTSDCVGAIISVRISRQVPTLH